RRLAGSEREFDVASNPEFLREGSAVRDFLEPDRIVIGADSARARSLLLELYKASVDCPIVLTSVTTAEFIKQAANAFLAAKIWLALVLLQRKAIAVVGVTFKPDTDDIRGAPSLTVVPWLRAAGADLRIFDPAGMPKLKALFPADDRLTYASTPLEAVHGAN